MSLKPAQIERERGVGKERREKTKKRVRESEAMTKRNIR